MTSSDPFSREQVPDHDVATEANADTGVSVAAAATTHSDSGAAPPGQAPPGYVAPDPGHTAPPQGYAAPPPGYGGHPPGAPNPLPSTDPVSVVALVAGLLGTGPVAFVLGAIGLRRTIGGVRRGRGMAWAGAILGLLAIVGWTLLFLAVFVIVNNADQTTGLSGMGLS